MSEDLQPAPVTPKPDREEGFWPIFFGVFGYDILAVVIAFAIGSNMRYGERTFFISLITLLALPLIFAIIAGEKGNGRKAGMIVAATFLAPIFLAIVGVGACFALLAGMSH